MAGWEEKLDEMQRLGDAAGDRAVKAVFDAGSVERVNALLAQLVRNEQLPDAAQFPELQSFLVDTAKLPEWADARQIAAGEEVFGTWGLAAICVLACASLPECYVLRHVARVLGLTGQLEDDVGRRMPETVMMVMEVMQEGGLAPSGRGVRATQKVRLMHAAIRHLVLAQPPVEGQARPATRYQAFAWDPSEGTPISQRDLAVVMLTFSHVVLRGWADLGIAVPVEQQQAFLHCWNVVGHVLGIEDRFLAKDPADARELFELIKRRGSAATPEGRKLTRALLKYCESFSPSAELRPVSRILMNVLLTRDTCAMLEVPPLKFAERIARVVLLRLVLWYNRFKTRWLSELPGSRNIAAWFASAVVRDLVIRPRGGARPPFQIPATLKQRWGM